MLRAQVEAGDFQLWAKMKTEMLLKVTRIHEKWEKNTLGHHSILTKSDKSQMLRLNFRSILCWHFLSWLGLQLLHPLDLHWNSRHVIAVGHDRGSSCSVSPACALPLIQLFASRLSCPFRHLAQRSNRDVSVRRKSRNDVGVKPRMWQ